MQRVLIVDDQMGIRLLLKEVLEEEGYTVKEAHNGELALHMVEEWTPEIFIIDMKLQGIDGLTLLKELQSSSRLENACVIIMTAFGEKEQVEAAKQNGADHYITKPFDIENLKSIIGKLSQEG
jgi:two-component system response regulator (stage 0 sporulation protein F)